MLPLNAEHSASSRARRRRFTQASVADLPVPTSGSKLYWDGEIPGFGARVFYTGRRVFVYQFRQDRRTGRITLGDFPALSVSAARGLAQQAAGQLARGERPSLRGSQERAPTVTELFPDFLAERTARLKPRTAAEYARQWEKDLKPKFGAQVVTKIDETAIARWHTSLRGRPLLANRLVDLLSGFFRWTEKRGYRPRHSNPCPGVERYPEEKKSHSLTPEEYGRLGAALAKAEREGILPAPKLRKRSTNEHTKRRRPKVADEPRKTSPVIIAALRFLALSGWREQEAFTLRWDAVDFGRGVAELRDTKTGRDARVLGEAALAVLRAQPRVPSNPFVFPGVKAGRPLTDAKYAWTSIRHVAGLEAVRLHDLRHSFATVASDELGIHDRFIARLIGHRLGGMTAKYGEVRDATLRTKADEISRAIHVHLDATPSVPTPSS